MKWIDGSIGDIKSYFFGVTLGQIASHAACMTHAYFVCNQECNALDSRSEPLSIGPLVYFSRTYFRTDVTSLRWRHQSAVFNLDKSPELKRNSSKCSMTNPGLKVSWIKVLEHFMTQNFWMTYLKRNHSSAILLGGPCVVTAAPTRNEAPDHLGQFSFESASDPFSALPSLPIDNHQWKLM